LGRCNSLHKKYVHPPLQHVLFEQHSVTHWL
jgi:hypothetical protein